MKRIHKTGTGRGEDRPCFNVTQVRKDAGKRQTTVFTKNFKRQAGKGTSDCANSY